ncbi:hypothetical protein TWF281_011063 [Arthrobotrys megalospora]
MSEAQDVEWELFRDLAWYLDGRLQPAARPIGQRKLKTRLERRCRLLEVDLRNALLLTNFGTGSIGGFGSGALDLDGSKCLTEIVQTLELHINELFLSSIPLEASRDGTSLSLPSLKGYPGLSRLIQNLKTRAEDCNESIQPLNLVLETSGKPALFSIQSLTVVHQLSEKVTELNAFFRRSAAEAGPKEAKRSRSPPREEEDKKAGVSEGARFRNQACTVINALHQFLPCSSSHKVRLQMQEQEGLMDLFVSGCNTNQWQEVQCGHHTSRTPIHRIKNLCKTLRTRTHHRLQIVVEALNDGSHNIHYSPQQTSRLYPQTPFSEPLDELIKGGCFRNISFGDISSPTAERFTLREKRALAFKLGVCFLHFFDAQFLKESWNLGDIMFLVLPKRKLQESQVYINCSLTQNHQQEWYYSPGHPVLTSFAKLLLEIDEGETWPGPHGDGKQDPVSVWVELCNYVEAAKRHRGPNSYLDAVTRTLYLHKDLNEIQSIIDGDELDTKVRDLIYANIVKFLELEVPQEARKRLKTELGEADPFQDSKHSQNSNIRAQVPDGLPSSEANAQSGSPPSRSTQETRKDPQVAIVCALPLEADAVQALFDEIYEDGDRTHQKQYGDQNIYTIGRIGGENIVLCHLPGMGVPSAARAAANLSVSYPRIRLILIVGICGAIPFLPKEEEIILGDIIISDSVVKYDHGRQYPDGYERKAGGEETLGPPNPQLQGLLKKLRTRTTKEHFQEEIARILQMLQGVRGSEYQYPGAASDILFPAAYPHKDYRRGPFAHCICSKCTTTSNSICSAIRKKDCNTLGCGGGKIKRKRLIEDTILPSVHIGKIASADTVMKSGEHRDELAREEGVIGFEMEGAGVWGTLPCVVIKGVCDYADSHKNKLWQPYAAATAAAATAAFVNYWVSNTCS